MGITRRCEVLHWTLYPSQHWYPEAPAASHHTCLSTPPPSLERGPKYEKLWPKSGFPVRSIDPPAGHSLVPKGHAWQLRLVPTLSPCSFSPLDRREGQEPGVCLHGVPTAPFSNLQPMPLFLLFFFFVLCVPILPSPFEPLRGVTYFLIRCILL